MPPQNQNDPGRYDFFMNPQQQHKQHLGGMSSLKGQILMILGVGVGLLIVLTVIASFLGGGASAVTLETAVAQDQQEISRVSTDATNNATDPSTRNFAITTEFTMTTDQQQLVTYLAGKGTKLSSKQLGLKQSSQTDQTLSAALSSGTYDQTYVQVIGQNLQSYAGDIAAAYKKTGNTAAKKMLNQQYSNAVVLIKQLKNLPSQ